MLFIKIIFKYLLFLLVFVLCTGCIPSPKPEINLTKKETNKKEISVKRNFEEKEKYVVIEKDFDILYTGKTENEIKKELLLLHFKKKENYIIGVGDKFNIFIYGEPELNIKGAVIKPDGTMTMQLIGDVKIAGMTINMAMKELSIKLKKYLINPIVSIILYELKSESFTILGKINEPGTYAITNNTKVIDTIAMAEGLSIGIFENNTVELANLEHAYIRRDNKVLPVNFIELIRKGNPLHNIPLEDKDYIYIPSALNNEVYVLGEVEEPGHFGFKEKMTLIQLITYAKGYKTNANINEVAIIRGNLTNPIVYIANLEKMIEGKQKDFRIKPNDIVFIPSSKLGDWNTVLSLIMPSLDAVLNTFLVKKILEGD
ncbi:MAG: polysaccharide biosynthesis/export family protein [Campylobacteraceae bacterium]|nr:polysaccharide biosynthesis/export family protein [Campylobacteraceae bacterium]